MQADRHIQEAWLRLLERPAQSDEVALERLEEGYYAVVLSRPLAGDESADFRSLAARIPNLKRTRAVYLSSEATYDLQGIPSVREWTGELATPLETGARHAVAVIDCEIFGGQVTAHLQRANWSVERSGEDLRLSDGHFVERLNLLRLIVRMVFSRGTMAEAARAARQEIAERFALDAALFERFARRYERFGPSIVDHYFTAYPESACMAAGWDYWEVTGQTPAEAEGIFEQAMEQFETFLSKSSEEWLLERTALPHQGNRLDN
jgi:hypothetical protein